MVLQSGVGLWLVGLGLALAIFIVMVELALNVRDGAQGGSSMSSNDRRNFLSGIVSLFIVALITAFLGSEAIEQLSNEGEICALVVNDGETYTVDSGDDQQYCRAEVDGTLNVNGSLDLSG